MRIVCCGLTLLLRDVVGAESPRRDSPAGAGSYGSLDSDLHLQL